MKLTRFIPRLTPVILLLFGCAPGGGPIQEIPDENYNRSRMRASIPAARKDIQPPIERNTTVALESLGGPQEAVALETYEALLSIAEDAEHLLEIANRAERGEGTERENFNSLLHLAVLNQQTELKIQSVEVAPQLEEVWSQAIKVHRITWNTIGRWGYLEIDATQVLREMKTVLPTINEVMARAEAILMGELEINQSGMSNLQNAMRERYLAIYAPVPVTGQDEGP